MKKLYIFFFLFINLLSVKAQLHIYGEAYYVARVNGWSSFGGSTCGKGITGGLQWITAIYENGGHHTFVKGNTDYPHSGHGLKGANYDESVKFYENNKITKIAVKTTRRDEKKILGIGLDCKDTDYRETNPPVPIDTMCIQKFFDYSHYGLNQEVLFDYSVKPEVNLKITNPIQDVLGYDHNLIVSPIGITSTKKAINDSFFKWQYKEASSSVWVDLPAKVQYKNYLNIKASDFLPTSLIGKNVQLRVDMGCNQSVPITFSLRRSSPKVINQGTPVKTTCFDTNDGQHRIYFDRPLDSSAKEYISIGLTNANTKQPVPISFTNITKLDSDNSFNLTGLPAGTYTLKIVGKYNGIDTYSETTTTPVTFTIERNPPVDFSISKTDVYCYKGTDGRIQISASGGTLKGYQYQLNGGKWIPFSTLSSTTHTINGLSEGIHTIKVRDGNNCIAKVQTVKNGEIQLGAEKQLSLTLTAPKEPLTVAYTLIQEPTYNGASNGKLVAKIDGGTIFDNNTYGFEWKNEQGQTIPATTQFTSGSFYITLKNIPAGIYYLTIRDKNYTNATDKVNCTIIKSKKELTQPAPLVASIKLVQPISCHVNNEFGNAADVQPKDGQRDESQNGILKVEVTGGKPFTGTQNGGKPYKYTWKKKNSAGVWVTLSHTEDTLPQLSDGNYAVNVEDANGIIIGVYQNNALVKATDVTYYLQQPEKLKLSLKSKPVTCFGGDGYAQAIVTGGTAPYTYVWSNGKTTNEITGLAAMSYFVTVTDARGCSVQGTVVVSQPENIKITETITPLLCHNASNASIKVNVTGGTAPYSFLWNNGAKTGTITNLSAGNYTVTITDAQGCSYKKSYIIENPKKISINLGEDRTLCNGQTLELDATIAEPGTQYKWTSDKGFKASQPKVVLSDAGTYTVTAVTPKGCVITDAITILNTNFAIDSEFLLTTQAYANEEVVLVNVSNPKGQTTEWIIKDSDVEVIEESTDYVTLRFPQEGVYTITLKQTQGGCYKLYDKEIIVEPNTGYYNPIDTNASFIKEFTVTPNPNDGNFTVTVELEKESPVKLRLFTIAGQVAQQEKDLPSAKVHSVDYNVQTSSGTYVLVLETPYQVLTKKLIIY
ncbi:MAG: T9SS type A sorting domain-containing protein [Flavobacteriaceae bacterium]|jgi:hypothetical protein|nr:T9SS type A sorting domain-containing protein [Flavobacteriaceae bacterium]